MYFHSFRASEFINELVDRIKISKKTYIVTANPEIVMYAEKDEEYKKCVDQADYVIADGTGVILGSKILGTSLPERIAGFDLMCSLLEIGSREGWSAYFLGAKEEVVTKALANVKDIYSGLTIAGYHNGYFKDSDSDSIVDEIIMKSPDLIFVALGFPRQEMWICENSKVFKKGLFMGVGGSFDVLAGTVKRAPVFWQKMNLEWFYRLIQEPKRWRRMLVLPLFVIEVLKKRGKR
ncbi:WecB/TagA/CpsF family glycosyltransferase [Bacillus sp. EB600]|nr:WecB/TagA/CpsF family glycosyltransferase [Bacillus sp. EB600]